MTIDYTERIILHHAHVMMDIGMITPIQIANFVIIIVIHVVEQLQLALIAKGIFQFFFVLFVFKIIKNILNKVKIEMQIQMHVHVQPDFMMTGRLLIV